MAFWKKFYKSKYTGAEIDAAVAKAGDATKVTANPTLAGTEAALTGLEVGTTKYKVEQPINVVANPTLAGTESALEGLQVGNTKYKVEAGTTIPKITITQEELGTLIVSIGSFLAAANDTIKLKTFYIDDIQGVSIANKLKTILDSGIGYIEIEGMMQSLAYKVGDTGIAAPAIAVMLGQAWVSFGCTYQISNDFDWVNMNITSEKINVQS